MNPEELKPVQTFPGFTFDQAYSWEEKTLTDEEKKIRNIYDDVYLNPDWFLIDPNLAENEFSIDGEVYQDISDEEYRHYIFDKKRSVMIVSPILLFVNEDGTHEIIDQEGVHHTVNTGWMDMEVEYID